MHPNEGKQTNISIHHHFLFPPYLAFHPPKQDLILPTARLLVRRDVHFNPSGASIPSLNVNKIGVCVVTEVCQ
jgi:hypothetical protein